MKRLRMDEVVGGLLLLYILGLLFTGTQREDTKPKE